MPTNTYTKMNAARHGARKSIIRVQIFLRGPIDHGRRRNDAAVYGRNGPAAVSVRDVPHNASPRVAASLRESLSTFDHVCMVYVCVWYMMCSRKEYTRSCGGTHYYFPKW